MEQKSIFREVLKCCIALNKGLADNSREIHYINSVDLRWMEKEIKSKKNRAERILDFGDCWNDDELLSVMTTYLSLKVIIDIFSKYRVYDFPSLEGLEGKMRSIDKAKNASAIQQVESLIRKNWKEIKFKSWNEAIG